MKLEMIIMGIVTVIGWGALYYGSWITTQLKWLPSYPIWMGEIFVVILLGWGYYMLLTDERTST